MGDASCPGLGSSVNLAVDWEAARRGGGGGLCRKGKCWLKLDLLTPEAFSSSDLL